MKKELTEDILINWWLEKHHNTNIAEIKKEHPDWTHDNPDYNSQMFYDLFPVTQEQHDEWKDWAFNTFKKHFKLSKVGAERAFSFVYLNCAPKVNK